MTPAYGRSLKGKKVYSERPTSQKEHYSTFGIIGKEGMLFEHTFKGFLNRFLLVCILEEFIIKHFVNTNKWLILDNASVHKSRLVIQCLKKHNINYLFLPPYSPELNPIELAWSKIKQFVKRKKPRTKSCLILNILKSSYSITEKDSHGYYRHSNSFLAT